MIKKALYMTLGFILLGLAYVGFVLPGIPFSIFLVGAAWAFGKSSVRMHQWMYSHPWFGEFLTNWTQKKIFPQRAKYLMVLVMTSSWMFLWFTTANIAAAVWSGAFMALVAGWAWRFPHSEEQHQQRIAAGKKIGWFR